jgi:1-acyl-sn-glycerol-3-phosphate acyltransferase
VGYQLRHAGGIRQAGQPPVSRPTLAQPKDEATPGPEIQQTTASRQTGDDEVTRLHRPKAGPWIRFCVAILYPLDSLLFRMRWRNLDRIPATGGVIIVINHISHIDTILMARVVWQSGRIPRFLVKNTMFSRPGLGAIFRGAKQIPVFRGTTDAANSLSAAVEALRAGEAIVIYPEGTVTKDPAQWPMRGKTGAARLALLAPDIPIIPIGQWGAEEVAKHRFRPLVQATVGPPVDLSRFRDAEPTGPVLREMTDVIMTAVRDEVAELRGEAPPQEFYQHQNSLETAD